MTAFLWILVSTAVAVAGAFVIKVIVNHRADRKLDEAVSYDDQQKILSSATEIEALRSMLADTGYAYDWQQNIFYSVLNPWQRQLGYFSLYDEAAPTLSIIIDCEPVRFEYEGKKWLIEFWKGQYGIAMGCEVGIYTTTGPEIEIPGVFNGTFYYCAADSDHLSMTYTLLRNNEVLFSRAARHWWLTGFRLGEYARPSELTMEVSITFKDNKMRDAFLKALEKLGYSDTEVRHSGRTVLILFKKPHSRQPTTRRGLISFIAMRQNKKNVKSYRKITKGLTNMYDIMLTLQQAAPRLFGLVLNLGRKKEMLQQYDMIKDYID